LLQNERDNPSLLRGCRKESTEKADKKK